jgi:hypothetical protein
MADFTVVGQSVYRKDAAQKVTALADRHPSKSARDQDP